MYKAFEQMCHKCLIQILFATNDIPLSSLPIVAFDSVTPHPPDKAAEQESEKAEKTCQKRIIFKFFVCLFETAARHGRWRAVGWRKATARKKILDFGQVWVFGTAARQATINPTKPRTG